MDPTRLNEFLLAQFEQMLHEELTQAIDAVGPFSLINPEPIISDASLRGYTFDTTFIGDAMRVTTLRQQRDAVVMVMEVEVVEDEIEKVEYRVLLQNGTLLAITDTTYRELVRWLDTTVEGVEGDQRDEDELGNDSEAYQYDIPEEDWVLTRAQEKLIEKSPRIVVADRMSHMESRYDGAGREKHFRRDTRWPADPDTGEPQPESPYPTSGG